ncbi:hypothetical protein COOONC_20711 [Cooperia oncophora]
METSSIATALQYDTLNVATVDSQRKKLELKLITGNEQLCTYDNDHTITVLQVMLVDAELAKMEF